MFRWGFNEGAKEQSSYLPAQVDTLLGVPRKGLGGVRSLSCGPSHNGVVFGNGDLYTWGNGACGKLGHGDLTPQATPRTIEQVAGVCVRRVACGSNFTVFVTETGELWAFGKGSYGELGIEGVTETSVPTRVAKERFFTDVDTGEHHVIAVADNGNVYSWGKGITGCLGHGDTKNQPTPKRIEALAHVKIESISSGENHVAALTSPLLWDEEAEARLIHTAESAPKGSRGGGVPRTPNTTRRDNKGLGQTQPGLLNPRQPLASFVSGTSVDSQALDEEGKRANKTSHEVPTLPTGGHRGTPSEASRQPNHLSRAFSGASSANFRPSPPASPAKSPQPPGTPKAQTRPSSNSVASPSVQVNAVNGNQVHQPNQVQHHGTIGIIGGPSPTSPRARSKSHFVHIEGYDSTSSDEDDDFLSPTSPRKKREHRVYHHQKIVTDRDVYMWGWGEYGRLANGSDDRVDTPQYSWTLSGRQVTAVKCGGTHTGALTAVGELFTCGASSFGQLGHGNKKYVKMPKQVRGALARKPVMDFALGKWHTAAMTVDGALYTWGWNEEGQLGHGDTTDLMVPTRVEFLRGFPVEAVCCGVYHTIACLADHRPWEPRLRTPAVRSARPKVTRILSSDINRTVNGYNQAMARNKNIEPFNAIEEALGDLGLSPRASWVRQQKRAPQDFVVHFEDAGTLEQQRMRRKPTRRDLREFQSNFQNLMAAAGDPMDLREMRKEKERQKAEKALLNRVKKTQDPSLSRFPAIREMKLPVVIDNDVSNHGWKLDADEEEEQERCISLAMGKAKFRAIRSKGTDVFPASEHTLRDLKSILDGRDLYRFTLSLAPQNSGTPRKKKTNKKTKKKRRRKQESDDELENTTGFDGSMTTRW